MTVGFYVSRFQLLYKGLILVRYKNIQSLERLMFFHQINVSAAAACVVGVFDVAGACVWATSCAGSAVAACVAGACCVDELGSYEQQL